MCSGMLDEVVECSSDKLSVCLNDHVHRFDRVNFVYAGKSGARYQYPFRLAFALTVHRAQGLTLNSLVVHASRMTWPGQLGVAIGRAKCINGLQVIGFGEGLKIKSQPEEVVKFYDQSGTFDCICLNEEDPPTQSTLSAVSSQATAAEEFDDYEDVTPEIVPDLDILCPEQDENEWNREAQLFNKERNRLLCRCDSLKKFVGLLNLTCLVSFRCAKTTPSSQTKNKQLFSLKPTNSSQARTIQIKLKTCLEGSQQSTTILWRTR